MSARNTIVMIAIALLFITTTAFSQTTESHPDDIYWSGEFGLPGSGIIGAVGEVFALTEYNGQIILAGDFSGIGSSATPGIAAYDGISWDNLGGGLGGPVKAVMIWNNHLVAGGLFSDNDIAPSNNIAMWDGSQWLPLGEGFNGQVTTLGTFKGNLIAAGVFTMSGEIPAKNLAMWDGKSWSALGEGINGWISTLCEIDSQLIVGGDLSYADRVLRSWNGTNWVGLYYPIASSILSVISYKQGFAVSDDWRNVRYWDGTEWAIIGDRLEYSFAELLVHEDQIYGIANKYGSDLELNILRDNHWESHRPGLWGRTIALCIWNNKVVMAGRFQVDDGWSIPSLAMYEDSNWSYPGSFGLFRRTMDLEEYNGQLVVTGYTMLKQSNIEIGIAKMDSIGWSAIGNDSTLSPSFVYMQIVSDKLYAVAAACPNQLCDPRLMVWNGSSWNEIPIFGYDKIDYNLGVYQNQLVACLKSKETGDNWIVATWDGQRWNELGLFKTTNRWVDINLIDTFEGKLIVGGSFESVDNVPALNIVQYDGYKWEPLGAGLSNDDFAYVVSSVTYRNKLICTGYFSHAGEIEVSSLASWDGHEWSSLGSGISKLPTGFGNERGIATTVYQGDLYIGGVFDSVDGISAKNIARYDGSHWHPLGSGLHTTAEFGNDDLSIVISLKEFEGNLYATGAFQRAGSKASFNIARWEKRGPTDVEETITESLLPDSPILEQNYPNPFNPGTTISYQLEKPANVTITIYNLLGQSVITLVDQFQPAGEHKIYWDGKNRNGQRVASGIYLYRLNNGDDFETRKMLLIK